MELELDEGDEKMDVTSKNDFNMKLPKILSPLTSVHHILNSSLFSWKTAQTPEELILIRVMCE